MAIQEVVKCEHACGRITQIEKKEFVYLDTLYFDFNNGIVTKLHIVQLKNKITEKINEKQLLDIYMYMYVNIYTVEL